MRSTERGFIDMRNSRRRGIWGAALGLSFLPIAGCDGGGGAADGERVVLPPTYKEREKEIQDGFMKAMKDQQAAKGRRARPSAAKDR